MLNFHLSFFWKICVVGMNKKLSPSLFFYVRGPLIFPFQIYTEHKASLCCSEGVCSLMTKEKALRPHVENGTHLCLSYLSLFFFSSTVSKKLTPIPAKVPFVQSGSMSDQPTGQPSPASLSPTPPSTPSPYGLSYPQGYSLGSGPLSPAAAPSLSSPPSLTSTLTKTRPTPKPRQRPTLPPPQPPTSNAPGSSPQSVEHTILDGMSPGESMSTGNKVMKGIPRERGAYQQEKRTVDGES